MNKIETNLNDMLFWGVNTNTRWIKEMDYKFWRPNQNDIIVMVAWTGTWKSTYAFKMAQANALAGKKVLIYSLETIPEVTIKNYIVWACWIKQHTIDNQSYTPTEKARLIAKSKELSSIKNLIWRWIEDVCPWQHRMSITAMLSDIETVSNKIRKEKIEEVNKIIDWIDLSNLSISDNERLEHHTVKLKEIHSTKSFIDYIIIDNLWYMSKTTNWWATTEVADQADIIVEFSTFSKTDISCPLFILHHINKATIWQPVTLSSIRWSNKIWDTSTVVLALNRPDPTSSDTLFAILKTRNSSSGVTDLLTEFVNWEYIPKPYTELTGL